MGVCMDFPKFFRTAIQNLTIDAEKWRGLALLVKRPDTLRTARGALEDLVLPATGSTFTDRDAALHVMQKPQFVCFSYNPGSAATLLAAVPGQRYFLHTVTLGLRMIAADTTTYIAVVVTQNGVASSIRAYTVPSVAAGVNFTVVLDVLCDTQTAITTDIGGGVPQQFTAGLVYSIVGAS